ncbi:MFS transporter [Herpetosiphon sp. NSE202]|uniref:MFS transporter n=1 Tax=Herpetosiphon sp. NSE202 TaxID=3351349 RepID=UPI0036355707
MKRSPLLTIFLIAFVGTMSYGVVIPITPFYAQEFGASEFQVGLIVGCYALMQFIFAPILGQLSDRFGRRPLLILSLIGTVCSLLLFGFANSLIWLFVGRMFDGATGGNISIAQAYVSDVTTDKDRARGMGMVGAALGLGFIAGPAIGALLSRDGNYQLPIFVAAGIAMLSLILTFFVLPEPERHAPQQGRTSNLLTLVAAVRKPNVGRLLSITLLINLAFVAFETTFALFAARRLEFGSYQTGYTLAGVGVVVAIVQGGLIRRLAARFGEASLIVAGSLLLALSLAGLGFIQNVWHLVAICIVLAIGEGLLTPSLSSLVSRNSTAHERGKNMGLYQSMSSLARIFAPLYATWMLSNVGEASPYLMGSVLVVAGALIAVGLPSAEPQAQPAH